MRYVYVDESGTVTPFKAGECFLVIAVLVIGQRALRSIELRVGREQKKADQRAGDELKAVEAKPKARERLLRGLAADDIAIVAIVLDKRFVCREPDDPEDWYRDTVATAVVRCIELWPGLVRTTLDKRYTKKRLRDELEAAIRVRIECLGRGDMPIEQPDSRSNRCLQAVDYVAWAIYQKYKWGNAYYYDIIKDRIVTEEVVRAE